MTWLAIGTITAGVAAAVALSGVLGVLDAREAERIRKAEAALPK